MSCKEQKLVSADYCRRLVIVGCLTEPEVFVFNGRFYEALEQGVTVTRCRGEFGMELAGQEPGMIRDLDHFHQVAIHRGAGEAQARALQPVTVGIVELKAMAMALNNLILAVHLARQCVRQQLAGLATEPHGATQVAVLVTPLDLAGVVLPLGNQRDDRVRRFLEELGALGTVKTSDITGILDHRHLHTEREGTLCSRA